MLDYERNWDIIGIFSRFERSPKMKIKRNYSYRLFAYGKDKDKYQIRLRVTFNGQRIDYSTGCQLSSIDAWDPESELVKPGYVGPKKETTSTINNDLDKIKDQIDTVFKYYEVIEKYPTPEEVTTKFKERLSGTTPQKPKVEPKKQEAKPKAPGFFEVYDLFMKECGEKNAWTIATTKKMESMRVDLIAFKKNMTFADLTESTLTRFVAYLRDTKELRSPRKKKEERAEDDKDAVVGLKNSTIDKKLGYLRWFLKWATDHGYNTNLAYRSFHPTLKKTQKQVIYLTKDELSQIRNLVLDEKHARLEPVRDIFLFLCFSGLRHSDVNNLQKGDVKADSFESVNIKTGKRVAIELNDITSSILSKYKDIPLKDGKALPNYTNQALNRDIKELCQLAGIDEEIHIVSYKGNERQEERHPKYELVGTHTGRRTFIVNALSLGIPPNIVMKWTGHNDYKAMRPYIDIVDSIKAESMTKFNGLI